MRPAVRRLTKEYEGRIEVVTVQARGDRAQRIAGKYVAAFTPTFVFVRPDGTVQNILLGGAEEEYLREQIEALLRSLGPE